MLTAAANHWVTLPQRGRARGRRSHERLARMEAVVAAGNELRLAPPIMNRFTRLVAVINPGTGRLGGSRRRYL